MRYLFVVFLSMAAWAADAPEQPIPFSHKLHVGTAKLPCKMCHPNPDPGETMTIAPASTCMQCHTAVKPDSPQIQKLAQYAKEGKVIPWVQIYKTKEFVWYSHRSHLAANVACADCHGAAAESEVVTREGDISMAACMTCHQMKRVSFRCNFCHERPQ